MASQAAVVFPFIIQAKRFLSRQIGLGDLVQTAQAFGRLQENLSFFRNICDEFTTYRATLERLTCLLCTSIATIGWRPKWLAI